MFPQPREQEETGLESLLAGWGLDGTAEGGSIEPRGGKLGQKGVVLDEGFVRAVKICLAGVRAVGAVLLAGLNLLPALDRPYVSVVVASAHRPLLGIEIAISCLDLVLLDIGETHTSLVRGATFAAFVAVRAVALLGPSMFTEAVHRIIGSTAWRGTLRWIGGMLLDFVSLL
jgi:hypothetical protein